MRAIVIAGAAFAACASTAQDKFEDMVYANERMEIRLTQLDCESATLATMLVASGALTPPKAAAVKRGPIDVPACWALDGDNDVLIGDLAGLRAYFPISVFHPSMAARHNWVRSWRGHIRAE